jgi:membrane-associated protein
LIVVAALAAIGGDIVGYAIGARLGRRLFKPDAKLFKTRYRDEADAFLHRYGAFALVLARFVPIVRTFLPPVVGTSSIPYRTFLLWNILGGSAWAVVLCIAGFSLGRIPLVANNIEVIAVLLAIVSVLPIAIVALARRRKKPPARHRTAPAPAATPDGRAQTQRD